MLAPLSEWTRGGLPGSSIRDGGRSAERATPRLDGTDENVTDLVGRYVTYIKRAVASLAACEQLERARGVPPRSTDASRSLAVPRNNQGPLGACLPLGMGDSRSISRSGSKRLPAVFRTRNVPATEAAGPRCQPLDYTFSSPFTCANAGKRIAHRFVLHTDEVGGSRPLPPTSGFVVSLRTQTGS
jgi:hypothetical protein